MRVLVGCECSQVVTSAFRAAGHEAFSCDLQPAYGDFPQFHFQADLKEVYSYINPDLFIAHPPCTFLSKAAGNLLFNSDHSIKDFCRFEKGLIARDFFLWCLSRPAPMVCVENPIPFKIFDLPKPSQRIEPFYYGHSYRKSTYLWLRGLPFLQSTCFVKPIYSFVMHVSHNGKSRSRFHEGIAAAMADQWGSELDGLQLSFDW